MSDLRELGTEVASSLERARTAEDASARVRAKLVAGELPRVRTAPPPSRRWRAVVALTLAAAIVLGIAFARRTPEPALTFHIGEGKSAGVVGAFIAAPPTVETPLVFSDGSKVRLAPSARVRVADVARDGARVLVESGTVHVSIIHTSTTRWTFAAGPVEVRVTGTKFDLAWDPEATGLTVRLDEGSVVVRGCGLGDEGRRVVAGEHLALVCKPDGAEGPRAEAVASVTAPTVAARAEAPPSDPAPIDPSPSRPVGTAAPSAAASTSTPAPQRDPVALARRGAHTEALMAAEANGFSTTCESLSGPDLLVLADAARYAGRFERATEALDTARRRFPNSEPAAVAAFELGRIAMDVRRDLPGAGDHFETYLRERPSGSFAREALGRAIEARQRSGDNTRAERLAVRYLAAYPDGPHAKLARKLSTPDPTP